MLRGRDKVTFAYMGAYWSIHTHQAFDRLLQTIEQDKPFDLRDYGARELRSRPKRLDYTRITERTTR